MSEHDYPGRLIAFEGIDGVGKSTQVEMLQWALGPGNVVVTREPGATDLGQELRDLLLHGKGSIDPRAEALMMAADRAQNTAEIIVPALKEGKWVITDRYIGSSLAYQGYGRGHAIMDIENLSVFSSTDLWPDLTILIVGENFDIDDEKKDRIEALGNGFFNRVQYGYGRLVTEHGWEVVYNTGKTPEEMSDEIMSLVEAHFDYEFD